MARGQIGTVVEELGAQTALVEVSDDEGKSHAMVACPTAELLVRHHFSDAI